MKINIKQKEYTLLIGHQNENKYRYAFNELAEKVFDLSFEDWYRAGYWNEKYIPYTIFDGDKAVANVSVNIMNFNTFGKQKRYIQIGTVMTDQNYRGNGLNKFLMQTVLDEWNQKCECIYLFANQSVLNLYPKYGFTRVNEYEHFRKIKSLRTSSFEKLNMDVKSNRDFVYDYAKNTQAFECFSMQENADLVMFYVTSSLKDCVYYLKSLDVIVIAQIKAKQLHLYDMFSKVNVNLEDVIDCLCHTQVDSILLGFTPTHSNSYEVREIINDDMLFVQKSKTKLFENNKLMFPLLSHA